MSLAALATAACELRTDDARALLDRQTRVLELIAGAAPLPQVLAEILTSLEQLLPGARCSVLVLDRARGTLHHGAAPSLPDGYVAAIDGLEVADGAGSCGTAAALNAPVVATDVRHDPRWAGFRAAADAAGLRSCWSTPIRGGDGLPIGTFAVYHPRPHRPSERERLLVERFTHLAAVAIDHAGLLGDLVASEERFRGSFDDNSLGMAIVGLDRTLMRSNRALVGLVGAPSDLVGRPLADVLTPTGRTLGSLLDEVDRRPAAPLTFEALAHRHDPDGARAAIEVEVSVSQLCGHDGAPAQYVVNVLDLTERRAAERERRARLQAETARRTAEELAHARSAMLAAVGHEARTPIQAIVGFAELLGTLDLDEPRRREALDHIDAAAGHVMDLLTDVLDLSRIEVNALPLALEAVDVAEVVGEVLVLLEPLAEKRRVTMLHERAGERVTADRRRLRQVLLNVVGNAIRHGRHGGRVVVRSCPSPERPALCVRVEDDGPGIAPELLPRIFTPFARASPAPHARAGPGEPGPEEGVGLGLGLAHGLMTAMAGELYVAGSSGSGTSMVLRIPLAVEPGAEVPADRIEPTTRSHHHSLPEGHPSRHERNQRR